MTQNLSPAAESIVINLSSSRQGTTPKGRNDTAALADLQRAGILGDDYGLTRKGSAFRDRLVAARLDAAFG
jgi:hypothetical protein